MNIPLDKDYYISSDRYAFKLYKNIVVNGKDSFRVQGYYITLNSCIKSYIQEKLKNSKAKSKSDVFKDLEQIQENITNMYKFIDNNGEDIYIGTLNKLLKGKIDLDTIEDNEED